MSTDNVSVSKLIAKPPAQIKVSFEILKSGSRIFRIHPPKYRADEFNPGFGKARFSPIADTHGQQIPTIYGGTSIELALMETVFHDIPFTPDNKQYDTNNLEKAVLSELTNSADLKLVKLSGPASRKLGITESDLIHSFADCYPQTRLWAEAIYAQHPDAQGLIWKSRQHTDHDVFMFFGHRVNSSDFTVLKEKLALTTTPEIVQAINDLALLMDVELVNQPANAPI